MSDYVGKKVWLLGAGNMAVEYTKVLSVMGIHPVVIGRGEESAHNFEAKTGVPVISGGLDAFLAAQPESPDAVINAVNVVDLASTTANILQYCESKVLLEKPGVLNSRELALLSGIRGNENIYIAYNRRFFTSTQAVRKMLAEDGGPVSCTFEFTEWAHRIETVIDRKDPEEMSHWLVANSSHVIDMAFFLAGFPAKFDATISGSLPWHPSGSVFCGSGITERGASFSYHANWEAPGRWWVEVMSLKRRFKMCPMETLQVQNKGEVVWRDVDLDVTSELELKPGLYDMVEAFFANDPKPELCRFDDLAQHFSSFQKMAGYRD
jgi:predicted dehydrogenase